MKSKLILAAALALGLSHGHAANAQSQFAAEATIARAFDVTGAELAVGYRLAAGNLRLTPMVGGFIYSGENPRYYMDTFSNGDEACRDSTNGRFVKSELCNTAEVDPYLALEAAYRFSWGELGLGVRSQNSETTPYATVSKQLREGLDLKLKGGSDYVAVGLALGF